jgi:N-acetylglucosamine kinase-like BadF-type ATPase
MQDQYILALDQGTTSSRAMLFDRQGNIISTAQKEFQQIYPRPGWVEHDPQEIWSTQAGVAAEAVTRAGMNGTSIAAIGITRRTQGAGPRREGPCQDRSADRLVFLGHQDPLDSRQCRRCARKSQARPSRVRHRR